MGRPSNAKKKRIYNLQQPSKKSVACPVGESDGEDDEYGPAEGFWMEEDSELSDLDDELSELDEDEETEVKNDADLLRFLSILHEAQLAARKEEAMRTRPYHYTGNSQRTKRRQAQLRHKLAEDPKHRFITDFFNGKKRKFNQRETSGDVSDPEVLCLDTLRNDVREVFYYSQ
jgi:hypothetical protein